MPIQTITGRFDNRRMSRSVCNVADVLHSRALASSALPSTGMSVLVWREGLYLRCVALNVAVVLLDCFDASIEVSSCSRGAVDNVLQLLANKTSWKKKCALVKTLVRAVVVTCRRCSVPWVQ